MRLSRRGGRVQYRHASLPGRARPDQPHRRRPRRATSPEDQSTASSRRAGVGAELVAFPSWRHRLPARGPPASSRRSSRPTCAALDEVAARHRAASPRSSASSTSATTSTTPPPSSTTARVAGIYHKQFLPNYGVFDENRYFQAGDRAPVFTWATPTFGVNICEDIWYPAGPTTPAGAGRRRADRQHQRLALPRRQGRTTASACSPRAPPTTLVCLAYVNLVGGQDELVFDGGSLVVDEHGELVARGRAVRGGPRRRRPRPRRVFHARLHDPRRRKEKLSAAERSVARSRCRRCRRRGRRAGAAAARRSRRRSRGRARSTQALVLGTRDYVHKNGFEHVVIGLSGGIDSVARRRDRGRCARAGERRRRLHAVAATPRRARGATPGGWPSNLGIEFLTIPIAPVLQRLQARRWRRRSRDCTEDVAEENIQARIRGNL